MTAARAAARGGASGVAVLGALIAFAIVATGCGSDSAATEGSSASGDVAIVDAWIRPTPPISNVGAFYLTIRNDGDEPDEVIGATAARCDEIEIHQTETVDDVSSMSLAESADLAVVAGGALVFEPSGLHVMCLGLDEPVEAGQRLSLTVEFDRAGPVAIEAMAENR